MNMSDSIKEVLYTEEQLQARVKELGAQITKDYAGKDKILLVSVLRGSYIFMADLSRAIDLPCLIDFMVVSSYGAGTSSSGQVEIKKDISSSIEDYHVIIVETSWFRQHPVLSAGCAQAAQGRFHPHLHPAG